MIAILLLLPCAGAVSGRADVAQTTVVARFAPQVRDLAWKGMRFVATTDLGPPREAPVGADLTSSLALPTDTPWKLSCAGAAVWCPRITVPPNAAGGLPAAPVTIPVFPAASLRGRVGLPRGESEPPSLHLQGRARRGNEVIEFDEILPLSHGAFGITVPRTQLDLRLSARGWAPTYLWGVEPVRDVLDVGVLTLRRGASVSGFVIDPATGRPLGEVEARLAIFAHEVPDELTNPDWARLTTARARGDRGGFFQISGVAPGRYYLELGRTGDPATTTVPIEVVDDAETRVGEIALTRAVVLHLTLSPATDPAGRPWKATLSWRPPGSLLFHERNEREADGTGLVRFERIRPGRYELTVRDSGGSSFYDEDLDIVEDRHAAISLPLVKVRGEVKLGESPLEAELHLTGDERTRLTLRTDAEGRFEGTIRRPQRRFLYIEVESETPRVRRAVLFRDIDPEAKELEVDVRLPDMTLSGLVVDDEGRPVRDAVAKALVGPQEYISAKADVAGHFDMRGLPEGRIAVWANHPGFAESAAVEVELSAAAPSADLKLTLSRGRRLRARLLSAEGQSVPGAKILVHVVGAAAPPFMHETDLAGNFTVVVAPEAALALVMVMAPTHMLWSACVPLPNTDEWTLSLPPLPAAELRIRVLRPDDPHGPSWTDGELFLVNNLGGLVREGELRLWMSALGQREVRGVENGREYREWTLPSVAPASYALISTQGQTPPHAMVTRGCTIGHVPVSSWQFVGPGGHAAITHEYDKHAEGPSRQ